MSAVTLARQSRFLPGLLLGLLILVGAKACINETPVPDWIVAPLLVRDDVGKSDAIVVLGASVVGACTPSNNALRRVLLAARLWREGHAPVILMTGGSGPAGCEVATAMARFAEEIGVPPQRLRIERASLNTHENAAYSGVLLRAWGYRRVLLVTDRLHMSRAAGAFAAERLAVHTAAVPIYEGHVDNVEMLDAGLREYLALAYYRSRGWFTAEQAAPAIVATDMQPRSMANPNGPVVVLGASYALGWPLERIGDTPVINKGITGQQSFELLERFERDVVPAKPRAVIVWGFINDVFRSPATSIDQTLERTRKSYVEMIALARKHGIEPIIATELTARPQTGLMAEVMNFGGMVLGKVGYQDQINRHVLATNDWLRELARQEGVLILDFQGTLAEPGGRRRRAFSQPDGSHVTPAGYAMLTSYSVPILQEFLVAGQ